MAEYKLIYYDIRGLAEVSRLIFALAEVAYEDYRIPYKAPPGPHNKIPEDIKPKCPYNQVPILVVRENGEERVFCQSNAIARYLARKFGKFYGSSDEEKALIDEVIEAVNEYTGSFRALIIAKDGESKSKAITDMMEIATPKFVGRFNRLLQENSESVFLVGRSISLADICVFNFITSVSDMGIDVTRNYPEMQAYIQNIKAVPQIKNWIEKRPVTPF